MREVLNTLYASTTGASLHLDGDAVRIYHPDQTGRRLLPLPRIDHIVVFRGTTITDDLLQRCASDGRTVTWLTGSGRFLARVTGPQKGPVSNRLAQYDAHRDPVHRFALGRCLVAAKLQNTRRLLLRAGRDATGTRQAALRATAATVAESLAALTGVDTLTAIMGVEGHAARRYVSAWRDLLTDHGQVPAPTHRSSRPPTDPVNAALSFGYGLLRVAVHGAIEQVGLDPHLGYLHGHRAAKPALALDLMESYRALLVDRVVFTAFNQRQLIMTHFETTPGGAVRLTGDGRRAFLSIWSAARDRTWPHPAAKSQVPAALIPLLDARILVRHLRGDTRHYVPWTPV
jgi:CRISP-associated protein Cas1